MTIKQYKVKIPSIVFPELKNSYSNNYYISTGNWKISRKFCCYFVVYASLLYACAQIIYNSSIS